MTETALNAGVSLLDEAFGLRLANDAEGALQRGLALVEKTPDDLWSAALLAAVLIDEKRTIVAGEAVTRIVDGFTRRGDLPAAAWVSHLADRAGENGRALRQTIAQVFGRGSARVGDVAVMPPPLPAATEVPAIYAKLGKDALLARAEDALEGLMARDDAAPADAPVPRYPLFAAMDPSLLEKLLGLMEVSGHRTGDEIIRQGDEGQKAFIVVRGMLRAVRHAGDEDITLAGLGPGAIVGEMALVSRSPRAASVIAVEPTLTLSMHRDDLERLAEKEPAIGEHLGEFCRARMLSNLIRHSPLLSRLDPAEGAEVVSKFAVQTLEPGDVLVTKGDESAGLFLIASGGVEVLSEDEEGDELLLAALGPGDVVGEISLVLRRPATAHVVAAHPTVALHLAHEAFHEIIRAHPQLLNELYEIATKREEETRSVVAQEAFDLDDIVLV